MQVNINRTQSYTNNNVSFNGRTNLIEDAGDALVLLREAIKKHGRLTERDEFTSGQIIRKNPLMSKKIQNLLVLKNIGLAIGYAKRSKTELSFPDRVMWSCVGLISAAERFDPSVAKFSTFAEIHMKKAVNNANRETGRLIRIAPNQFISLSRVTKAQNKLFQRLEREPMVEEIANEVIRTQMLKAMNRKEIQGETTENIVKEYLTMIMQTEPTSAQVEHEFEKALNDTKVTLEAAEPDTKVIDSPLPNSNLSYEEVLEDTQAVNPLDKLHESELKCQTKKAFGSLSKVERQVMIHRFGLKTGIKQTHQEISEKVGVSRERIRQIEEKSKAKLKCHNYGLKEFA